MNRGSIWRQWDLHFHTPSSYDYEDSSVTNQNIIDGLIANNVSAVAITDHHVMDVARIRELQALAGNRITVFPGIEFLSDARGKEPVHIIGIFAENADIEYIWGQLENKTNIQNIKGEGKKIFEVYCDLVDTCRLVHELGGLITIHAGSKSNGIDKITNSLPHYEAQKEDISKIIDIYDMGKEEDLDGYRKYVFPNIGRVVPMIMCSDNHNINNYTRKQICWIKSDITFEGLKQVLYEPEERVCISSSSPDTKSIYSVIDCITLDEPGFWHGIIPLNSNLNTIIGGRSTGKSSLLKAIAAKHKCGEIKSTDYILSHLDGVTVRWNDGNDEKDRDIDYFPQSYMHEIARDMSKTNRIVSDILKQRDNKGILANLANAINGFKKSITSDTYSLFSACKELNELKKMLSELGLKTGVVQQIEIIKKQIAEIQSKGSLTTEDLMNYQGLVNHISEKTKQVEQAEKDLQQFSKYRMLSPFIANFGQTNGFDMLSFSMNASEISRLYNDFKVRAEVEWVSIIDGFIQNTTESKEQLLREIEVIKQNPQYLKGVAHYQSNQELKEITEKLTAESKKLEKIEGLEKKVEAQRTICNQLLSAIINAHLGIKNETQLVVDSLKVDYNGLSIRVDKSFNQVQMKDFLEARLNLRGSSKQEYVYNLLNQYDGQTKEQSKRFLLDLIKNSVDLKNSNSPLAVATEFLSSNWYSLDYQLNYQGDNFVNMSEGKQAFVILKLLLEFSNKKCPILIDQPEDSLDNRAIYNELVEYIKSKKRERQIIIVTHNSNVVVSADAENVIVANQDGTNSHNVDSMKFQYINGSLESSKSKDETKDIVLESQGIREHVCDILEGGRDAFEKREHKYGFRR